MTRLISSFVIASLISLLSSACGQATRREVACSPLNVCPPPDNCGTISDGCGGTVDCGSCASAAETCGGGGAPNVCGGDPCLPGAALVSVAVSPANGANGSINQGYAQQLIALAFCSDGTTTEMSATWRSSDDSKATVDANGLATGVSVGTATITASEGAISGGMIFTVNPPFDYCTALAKCTDTDGDGFCDSWEDQDYIDFNGNGVYDEGVDFHFPHQTPYLFSEVTHSGTGGGRVFPSVHDPQLPADHSVVITIASDSTGVGTGSFTYTIDGGAASAPLEIRPVVNLDTSNLRVNFYGGTDGRNYVTGDTYSFSVSMGMDAKVADKDVPNIYVQYDYMDFDVPTSTACSVDADCDASGNQLNAVCRNGYCNHNHYPADPLFRKVVDAFANHGLTLYIDPVHYAVPHASVVTFAQQGDGTTGATAACAGADVTAGVITGAAVNFHDIKNRSATLGYGPPFDPLRRNVFHYTVLSHANTCLTATACQNCPPDRSTPSGYPLPGASGTSELPGNDFIISLGPSLNNPLGSTPSIPFVEQGVFMHELGHQLGLHHAGDVPAPEKAPNYLSIMNYRYTFPGIQHASTPGGTTPVEDLREITYSDHTLNTLVESSLSESAGTSPLSSGHTGIVRFYNGVGGIAVGPESGPIDWDGDGASGPDLVSVDLNLLNGATETMVGYNDWAHTTGQSGAGGGACVTSADCRINAVLQNIHDNIDKTIDIHEACVRGVCQPMIFAFQCFPWGKADGPAAPDFRASCLGIDEAKKTHSLYPILTTKIEIGPGINDTTIAAGKHGEVTVALLGSSAIDVRQVDHKSLRLAGIAPNKIEIADHHRARRPDLLMTFDTKRLKVKKNAKKVVLSGWLKDSQMFMGEAEIGIAH